VPPHDQRRHREELRFRRIEWHLRQVADLLNVRVAVVLLDLAMPEMDGWEFLERKAADLSIAAVPVVIVTGTEGTLDPVTMSRVEVVLHKPLRNGDLLAAVARFLAVPRSTQQLALFR